MQLSKVPLHKTQAFSDFFLDYIQQKETLSPFYNRFPSLSAFGEQIDQKKKSFPSSVRAILTDTIQQQYKGLTLTENVKNNISLLKKDTTFTVTTGHQLNIFTGPLYFIYKIVTVVNTCRILKEQYPQYDFVPVYWMASEDHDYDEIKSFRLYGKKYTWNTNQQGAVGRFSTEGFADLLKDLPGDISVFERAYKKSKTLAEAGRFYVNEIFGNEGVVVVDGDAKSLKALFTKVITNDLIAEGTKKSVETTNKKLEGLGYKAQVYCRDINFFYLEDNLRSRIEKKDNRYTVIDSNVSFTEREILEAIEKSPEKFSPNVILRPLYQETILPNLAYVGGPAEVIYWLQLKELFDQHQTPFPILMPRNFAMVIEHNIWRKVEKTGIEITELFQDKNDLFNHWITTNTHHDLSTDAERISINRIFSDLKLRSENIDKTLGPLVAAECKRAMNGLDKIEKKLLKAEKRIQTEKLRQIEAVKDALYPNGGLQERVDNFLNFYQTDKNFIQKLIHNFDPFDFRFNILLYSE